jgi:hypothetical protein
MHDYEVQTESIRARRQRLLAAAAQQRQLKAGRVKAGKGRWTIYRATLYRVGGLMKRWGEGLQQQYGEQLPWLGDAAEANGG